MTRDSKVARNILRRLQHVKKNFGVVTTSKLLAKGKISTKISCFHFTKQHISRDGVFGYFNLK